MSNWIKYIVLNKEKKKWPIHWTTVKHSKSTGKCKVILLWDSISHLLERLPEWNKWQEMLTGIWKKRKLSSRLVRMNNCLVATMQIAMLSPQNIEINYHMTQLYPLLYISKVLNRNAGISVTTARPLRLSKKQNEPRCSSTVEEKENVVHLHISILCSHNDKYSHNVCGKKRGNFRSTW